MKNTKEKLCDFLMKEETPMEFVEFVYDLVKLGAFPSKGELIKLCKVVEMNYDTAYPIGLRDGQGSL